MIKNKLVLEVQVNERSYSLELSHESPLGEIYDVLAQMQSFCIQKMQDAQPKKDEVSKVEELPKE